LDRLVWLAHGDEKILLAYCRKYLAASRGRFYERLRRKKITFAEEVMALRRQIRAISHEIPRRTIF
jgi:hypothetical protein